MLPMKTIFTLPFLFLFGFLPFSGQTQFIKISGYVTDFLTENTIENATVYEKSSGIGTISDHDGFYKLTLKPGSMNISFTKNGFESFSRQFIVSSDTTLMIQLKPEKWAKNHEKAEPDLHSELPDKKNSDRKKFWFF